MVTTAQYDNTILIIAKARLVNAQIKICDESVDSESNRLKALMSKYWVEAKVDTDLLEFAVTLITASISDFINPKLHTEVVRFYVPEYHGIDDFDEEDF